MRQPAKEHRGSLGRAEMWKSPQQKGKLSIDIFIINGMPQFMKHRIHPAKCTFLGCRVDPFLVDIIVQLNTRCVPCLTNGAATVRKG